MKWIERIGRVSVCIDILMNVRVSAKSVPSAWNLCLNLTTYVANLIIAA